MPPNLDTRLTAGIIAQALIFKPYIWGGDNPLEGFDCSGFVVEVLKSIGIMDRKSDYTADGLSRLYPETKKLFPGNLIFYDWDKDGKIDDVQMVFKVLENGTILTIGASGGRETTKTRADAVAQDAYIKVRPAREGYTKVVDPF